MEGTEAKFPERWALVWLCPPCPDPLLQEARVISPSLNPDLTARLRPGSPSKAVLVPLLAQGYLQSAGPQPEETRDLRAPHCAPLQGRPPPPLHPCAEGGRPGAPRGAQARRRLSLTHSRGRNADGRAALWSRLRPTDGGRRPGTQPVGLGSPPSC